MDLMVIDWTVYVSMLSPCAVADLTVIEKTIYSFITIDAW